MNLEVIKNHRPFRKGTIQVIRSANQATDFYLIAKLLLKSSDSSVLIVDFEQACERHF